MPGASTQPLRQDVTKRRFFFSGTPYGDFDEVPTEAKQDYFDRYSLLLHLGWNTMIQEDYDKLSHFVENGGTLLIGLPQFSRHVKRDFLEEMMELNLWNDGDLSEFCGLKVVGPGKCYSGQWNAIGREEYVIPELSAVPSKSLEGRPMPSGKAGADWRGTVYLGCHDRRAVGMPFQERAGRRLYGDGLCVSGP